MWQERPENLLPRREAQAMTLAAPAPLCPDVSPYYPPTALGCPWDFDHMDSIFSHISSSPKNTVSETQDLLVQQGGKDNDQNNDDNQEAEPSDR